MYENLKDSGLLTNLDINYMRYEYKFMDKNVQQIFSIVESSSLPSKTIFYALKVISKRQFNRTKKDNETMLAQSYVEENGEIFLEVMDKLARYFQGDSSNTIEDISAIAQHKVDSSIMRIQRDIAHGFITDSSGFISEQIEEYQANLLRLAV